MIIRLFGEVGLEPTPPAPKAGILPLKLFPGIKIIT